jgi:iron complex outermembrane recepter protein
LPFADRTPANAATRVFTGAINAAALRTRGLDFDLGYTHKTRGGATISTRLTANRVLRYATRSTEAAPPVSQAGFIDHSLANVMPKWAGRFDVSLRRGGFSANAAMRYIDKLKLGLPPGTPGAFSYTDKRLPAITSIDLGVSQAIPAGSATIELYANASNLFDSKPPIFPGNNLAGLLYPTLLPLYDVVGRYLTIGIRVRR